MSLPEESSSNPSRLPLLPLRDVVVFPHMVIPLFVGRPKSIKALEAAMEAGKSIVLVAQKSAAKDDPARNRLAGDLQQLRRAVDLDAGCRKLRGPDLQSHDLPSHLAPCDPQAPLGSLLLGVDGGDPGSLQQPE